MKAAIISGSNEPYKLSTVAEIELPAIKPHQLLIESEAFAINPTDWKHITSKMGQPGNIIGSDVSGKVVEVGSEVTGFKVGDYVSSFLHGNTSDTEGAFGEYTIVPTQGTIKYGHQLIHNTNTESRIIDSFEGAAAVTLGLSTLAQSYAYSLGIDYEKDKNKGKFILIWGGATASGILGIQLAKLIYGLQVITTASTKNHEYLKSLGADHVFDYKDLEVVSKIRNIGQGKIVYGLDTIAEPETFQQVYDATEGTPEVFLDSLLGMDGNFIDTKPERVIHYGYTLAHLVFEKEFFLNGITFKQTPEMLVKYEEFWTKYLPKYLDQIKHSRLLILKPGLESTNEALELSRQGKVSAEKVVFTL